MDDGSIVALYWARDEQAITETDRRYGAYCRTISRNILTSAEDAEECVSDTYHHAWNSIPPQRPDSLAAFLGRIVRNLSISRWRREHAGKRFSGLDCLLSELEECLPAPGGVEEAAQGHALTACVESWLAALSAEDRALFLRRYWYGEAVNALAASWHVRPNQMTKRLGRLRKSLRAALEREGFAP